MESFYTNDFGAVKKLPVNITDPGSTGCRDSNDLFNGDKLHCTDGTVEIILKPALQLGILSHKE